MHAFAKVTAGYEVTPRTAILIFQLAANADEVNGESVGKIVANFAGEQTMLEIRRSLPAVKITPR